LATRAMRDQDTSSRVEMGNPNVHTERSARFD